MIDEKKLIEDIWSLFNNEYNNAVKYDEDETKLADKILSHVQKKIEAQLQIGQWIPCSERLPEAFDNVLISTKEGGRAIAHRCPNQSEGRFYDLHSSAIDSVVAWQPLPEPYKPKGE